MVQQKSKRMNKRKPQAKSKPVKNLERRVTKLERQDELKFIDTTNAGPLSSTPTSVCLNAITRGDDPDERIGDEVTAQYLNMKLRFYQAAGTVAGQVRCLIFWDKQSNGIAPTILSSTDPVQGLLDNRVITSTQLSPHSYITKDRYVVLYDKLILINPDDSTADKVVVYKKNIKLHGCKVKYEGSTGTFASIATRALWFCFVSTSATIAVPTHTFRLWYTDS